MVPYNVYFPRICTYSRDSVTLQLGFRQYGISQLRIVRSGLHLVTYLDVGNFCDKKTEKTLHEICVQSFLRFSDSKKQSQSVSLIYEMT